MLSTLLITADIDLYYYHSGIVFARLFNCETIALLKESHFAHLTFKEQELCFLSWRGIILKNFWNSFMQEISHLSLICFSINHLFQYGLKGIYLIFWLIIQHYIIFFVVEIILALELSFLCLFVIPPLLWYFVCFVSIPLLPGSRRFSRLIF